MNLGRNNNEIISNLPNNLIQTRGEKNITDNDEIITDNDKIIIDDDRIITDVDKIITDNDKILLEPNCVKSQIMMSLQYLPDLVLETIFGHFTFHEIANLRVVCRRFNEINKRLLNKGYRNMHKILLEYIQMPWEPKFQNRLNSYLDKIEATLLVVDLVFYHHIITNRCCFFPGKILDVINDIFVIEDEVNGKTFKRRPRKSEVSKILTFELLTIIFLTCERAMMHAVNHIFPAFNISAELISVVISSTTSPFIHEYVLKSVLGGLSPTDIWICKLSICLEESFVPIISRIINQLKAIKIKYDNPIRGIERCLEIERVLGAFVCQKKYIALVQWKGQMEAEFVSNYLSHSKLGTPATEFRIQQNKYLWFRPNNF